jgi:hypothetical protein
MRSPKLLIASATMLACTSLAGVSFADNTTTPPATTGANSASGESTVVYNKRRPNKALLITGSALLVGTYVTTAALAGANGPEQDKNLYIPVVGPWLNLADRTTASGRAGDTRDTVLIAGSGVLQGAGAALLITSFFVPEKVPAARISAGNVKMQITPTAAPGAGGLGAIGTF